MDRKTLTGKVALVAGATRGAGRGIAVALGEAGATVYCTGRSTQAGRSEMDRSETIEETAALVDAAGGHGIAVRVDHLVPDEVRELVARIEREQGALHLLVGHLDLGAVGHAVLVDAIGAEIDLFLRERHAVGLGAELFGGARHERAPAATDVEQRLTLLELQLGAGTVDLAVLRLLERHVRRLEGGGRVNHGFTEAPLEEVVTAVVVLADDAAVLRLGVNRHFGQEVREGPADVRVREPERHRLVAGLEELLPLVGRNI